MSNTTNVLNRANEESIVKIYTADDGSFFMKRLKDGESRQISEDVELIRQFERGRQVIKPPHDPLLWASMLEKNSRLNSLIHAFALNTCGLGWDILPKKTQDDETSEDERKKINQEIATARAFFETPNEEMATEELFTLLKVDEEATGNAYIEAVSDVDGNLIKIYHMPAHTMRVRPHNRGYIQVRGQEVRYFRRWGDETRIHFKTGQTEEERGEPIPPEELASEVIHFKIYTPMSSFYGSPRFVSAAGAITGNRLSAIHNVVFFENNGCPRLAIIAEGASLTDRSAKSIRDFLNLEGKGAENAHRVLVVETGANKQLKFGREADNPRIRFEKLTIGDTDDASFQQYRKNNDEEIRECFRIAPIYLGSSENVNRAVGFVMRQITIEQVFVPDQKSKEYRVNHTIMKRLGLTRVRFHLQRPTSADPTETSENDERYANIGGFTPNEVRAKLGLKPLPKKHDVWANVPFELSKMIVQSLLETGRFETIGELPPEELVEALSRLQHSLNEG